MLDNFLKLLKEGYTVEFSENNTLGMTEIVVKKHGKTGRHAINLDHLKTFGLDKGTTLMVVIQQLISEMDAMKDPFEPEESDA